MGVITKISYINRMKLFILLVCHVLLAISSANPGRSTLQKAFTRPDFCSLPPIENGSTKRCPARKARIPMYHWDNESEVCVPYIYGGCGGTENLFKTKEECYDTCDVDNLGWLQIAY